MSTIILATRGAYSDFAVEGIFHVAKPFTMAKVIEEMCTTLQLEGRDLETNPPSPMDLSGYMVRAGYVQVADYHEVHLGEYGSIEIAEPDREWKP